MKLLILGDAAAGEAVARAMSASHADARWSRDDDETGPRADAIIILVGGRRTARPLAELNEADWSAAFEVPLRQARLRLQAAERMLAPGGRAIMIASTGGMSGVAGDVAGCAVEEGARALAKSVALAWQPRKLTLCFAAFAREALDVGGPGIETIVVPTVRLLLAAPPQFSGSTVIVDGAVLLAP